MAIKIIGAVIGALILGFGIYFYVKEKNDKESRKIYGTASAFGAVIFIVSLVLAIISL